MRTAEAASCAFAVRRGCSTCLASLILEEIYLRKEGLIPFMATHALVGIMGIAALMLTVDKGWVMVKAIREEAGVEE